MYEKRYAALRWLLPESKAARVMAALWTLACFSVFIRSLRLLGLAETQAAGGSELIFMLILSFPAGLIVGLPLFGLLTSRISNGWNGWQALLVMWLFFFVPGYLQWFCLPRVIKNSLLPAIEKMYEVFPQRVAWVRRKCGIKDTPDISCIPKDGR